MRTLRNAHLLVALAALTLLAACSSSSGHETAAPTSSAPGAQPPPGPSARPVATRSPPLTGGKGIALVAASRAVADRGRLHRGRVHRCRHGHLVPGPAGVAPRRPLPARSRRDRVLRDPDRRAPTARPGQVQRHRRGRVAQRQRWRRLPRRLHLPGRRAAARAATRGWVCRPSASGSRAARSSYRSPGLSGSPALGLKGTDPARYGAAPPSRRRLLLRHLHPGGAGAAAPGCGRSAPRPRREAAAGHGRVTGRVHADDLRRRGPAADPRVRRLPDPQPGRRGPPRSAADGASTSSTASAASRPSSAPTSPCR